MRSLPIFIILAVFFLITVNYSDAKSGDSTYIFVQTTLRDSDGNLVKYLEFDSPSYFNAEAMKSFLDYEASQGSQLLEVGDKKYQLIQRERDITYEEYDSVKSHTLSDTVNGMEVELIKLPHDGYFVVPGDTEKNIWTILRPL